MVSLITAGQAQVCRFPVITPSALTPSSQFGFSRAADTAHAIIGARADSTYGPDSGAAVVYSSNPSTHGLDVMQVLRASDVGPDRQFGHAVDIDGDVAIVGAPGLGSVSVPQVGAAYIFRLVGGSWVEEQILVPPMPTPQGSFGINVAIEGDLAAVGQSDAVVLFRRLNGVWMEEASFATTGAYLALSEGRFACYTGVYRREAGNWIQEHQAYLRGVVMRDGLLGYDAGTHVHIRERDAATQSWNLLGAFPIASASFAGASVGGDYVGYAAAGSFRVFRVRPILTYVLSMPFVGSPEFVDGRSLAIHNWDSMALFDIDCLQSVVSTRACEQVQPNSMGFRARLDLLGSSSLVANDATLVATLLPFNSFALYLASRTRGASSIPGSAGGTLCLGAGFGRFLGPNQVPSTGQSGYTVLPIDLTSLPTSVGSVAANAGETWHFQCWYRDTGATFTSHLTDVASVTWL